MLTTARKIEIAESMIGNVNTGSIVGRGKWMPPLVYGICVTSKWYSKNANQHEQLKKDFKAFAKSLGIITFRKKFWFNSECKQKARTERIDFLSKYIEHLKKEL